MFCSIYNTFPCRNQNKQTADAVTATNIGCHPTSLGYNNKNKGGKVWTGKNCRLPIWFDFENSEQRRRRRSDDRQSGHCNASSWWQYFYKKSNQRQSRPTNFTTAVAAVAAATTKTQISRRKLFLMLAFIVVMGSVKDHKSAISK